MSTRRPIRFRPLEDPPPRPASRLRWRPVTPALPAAAGAVSPAAPRLGEVAETGETFCFPLHKGRRHTHIMGGSGMGKSKLMEKMIQQDLEDPETGLCLIDPHGPIYDGLVHYISHERPDLASRVVLFDPSHENEYVLGFNPFGSYALKNPRYALNMMVRSVFKVWGQDSTMDTPRLSRVLTNIFYLVLANDLTLVEAAVLLDTQQRNPYLDQLLETAHNHFMRADWEDFKKSTKTQKEIQLEGASNRMRRFLLNDRIRLMFGQQENILDMERIVREKKVLLAKLPPTVELDHEDNQLIGVLLIAELFRAALTRDPFADPPPFYLYIDEFAQYVCRDIARILEEARKFGLFLVLAHQHISQLKQEDEYLLSSILGLCRNRIVFGGLSAEDARLMGQEIYTGFQDLNEVKHIHTSARFRPQSAWQPEYRFSESEEEGGSEALARAFGQRLEVGEALARSLEQGISLSDSTEEQQSLTRQQGSEAADSTEHGHRRERGQQQRLSTESGECTATADRTVHTERDAAGESSERRRGSSHGTEQRVQVGQGTVTTRPLTAAPLTPPYSETVLQDREENSEIESSRHLQEASEAFREEHSTEDSRDRSREHDHHVGRTQEVGSDHREGDFSSATRSRRRFRGISIAETLARQHRETRQRAERETLTQERSRIASAEQTRTGTARWGKIRQRQIAWRRTTEHEEFQEQRPEFMSLPEILHRDAGRIMRQPVGTALFQLGEAAPVQVRIDLPIQPPQLKYSARRSERLRQNVFRAGADWYLPVTAAQAAITARQTTVFGHALYLGLGAPPLLPELPAPEGTPATAADTAAAIAPAALPPMPAATAPPAAGPPFPDDDA